MNVPRNYKQEGNMFDSLVVEHGHEISNNISHNVFYDKDECLYTRVK